ncbi:MAG: twin-arginine translocase TatA/TatE family subunit [Paludibacteraceae bacterium]|nr:twin-arginine translocase TatA/TatE family subunit [Paludibacteraceae bacterium]
MLGTWEIILIVLVILLIFGGKKIPELMKGLGKGVKSFKDGVNGKADDGEVVPDETGKTPDGKEKEEVKEPREEK